MTCQECTEFLFEELDGGGFNRSAVVHLSECADCRDLARDLRANAVALRSMRDDVVPSQPLPNVFSMPTTQKRPRQLYWLAAAAALVVAVGLGVMRMNQTATPEIQHVATVARPQVAEALPTISQPSAIPALEQRARNREERSQRQAARSQRASVRQLAMLDADRQPASSGSQTALKILTADPNVVIYWLGADTSVEGNSEGKIL
jgi:hypothetical protein